MNKNSVRKFLAAFLLVSSIGASLLSVSSLRAQTPAPKSDKPADDTVSLEKFEVTGSYLPQSATAPASRVSVLNTAAIESSGATGSILDVLRRTSPQFTGNGNLGTNNANTSSGRNNGASEISFRNLPTLVLVNGRRLPYSPVASTGGNLFVDVNLIPLAAIERIEILQDGGSALYGSDAIAGVVNIILKSDYQGFEIRGKYAFSDNKGNYSERQVSLIGGVSNGKTSITVSADWYKADPLYLYERSFSNPIYGTSS